jgi:hypothetical protein
MYPISFQVDRRVQTEATLGEEIGGQWLEKPSRQKKLFLYKLPKTVFNRSFAFLVIVSTSAKEEKRLRKIMCKRN